MWRSASLGEVKVLVIKADVRIICPSAIAGHWIPRAEALLCFFNKFTLDYVYNMNPSRTWDLEQDPFARIKKCY